MMQAAQGPQNPVPPELGALLTLIQGMQQGKVAPATPDGQPTVAGQAVQAAQQSQQQAAQQAALGAQQQQAQQQAAMQRLPQQVQELQQRQQAMEQGIAQAPGAGAVRMASGGIVGYAGGGAPRQSQEEQDRAAIIAALEEAGYGAAQLAAAGADIFTLPVRALAGIYNSLARGPRAMGVDIPFIPKEFGTESISYYSDMLAPREGGATGSWGEPSAPMPAAPPAPDPNAKMPDAPPAPDPTAGGPGGPGGSRSASAANSGLGAIGLPKRPDLGPAPDPDAAYREGLANIDAMSNKPPSQGEIVGGAMARREGRRAYMKETGNDPDQELKDIEAAKAREAERMAHIAELEAQAGGQPNASLIDFLLGARGFKGEGIGKTLRTGAVAMQEGDEKRSKAKRTVKELKFAYQDAAAREQALLRSAKLKTDMGDFTGAEADLKEAQALSNEKAKLRAQGNFSRAGDLQKSADNRRQAEVTMYGTDVSAAMDRAKMASNERIANIAANARGPNAKNPYDVINDNVQKEFDAWLKDARNMYAQDHVKEAKKQEILQRNVQVAASFGLIPPGTAAAGAAPPAAGNGGFKVLGSRPAQ